MGGEDEEEREKTKILTMFPTSVEPRAQKNITGAQPCSVYSLDVVPVSRRPKRTGLPRTEEMAEKTVATAATIGTFIVDSW